MIGISDDHGWIKLHRKMQFNFLWTESRTFSKAEAWIDMLMEARHSEKPTQILIGSHLIECGRGQCIKSLESWGRRWHWNKSKVRRFFALLQEANQIRLENVTKTTRITICNYDTYNGTRNENETILKRSCNDDETRLTPNKNVRREERKKGKKNTTPYGEAFLAFWNEWPKHKRKVDKPKCAKLWKDKHLDESVESVMQGLRLWQRSESWRDQGGQFIPAPEVWLRNERYNDTDAAKATTAQHQPQPAKQNGYTVT